MSDEAYEFLNSGGKSLKESAAPELKEDQSGSAAYNFFASGGKIPEEMKSSDVRNPPSQSSETENSYALPDTTLGRAATGVLGIAKGANDMLSGAFQLASHGVEAVYPKSAPGYELVKKWKEGEDENIKQENKNFHEVTRNTGTSAAIGEYTGNAIASFAVPQGKITEGANLIDRMIASAKMGAKVGAISPVSESDDANFWIEKAKNTGLSALTAFVGTPLIEGAVAGAGKLASGAVDLGKRVADWAKGKVPDEAIDTLVKNASPEIQQAVSKLKSKGMNVDPVPLARQLEGDALPVKVRLTPGQANQDPVMISQELNTRSKNPTIVYHLQDQNSALIQNLNHVRDTGARDVAVTDHITAGENLIKAGQDIIDKKAEETTALYKKLTDANGGSLPIDGKSFVESAEESLKKNLKSHFLPAEVRSTLNDIKEQGQMSFEQFENLRTILATEARSNTSGNARAASSLVREALENTPISSEVKGVKELADAARKSAKEGFDMLDKVPALKAIDSGKALDNNFIQKYVIGAPKKDLTSLIEHFKDDPVALQTIKAGTVNFLKKSAGLVEDSGNFGQASYNKQLQALGPKLDIIFSPDEAAILRTVGNVSRYVGLAPKGSYVNTSNTDVANLARQGAASAVDRITGTPIGSITKGAVDKVIQKKMTDTKIAEMVGPAAGVGRKSAANDMLTRKIPQAVGRGAVVPISALVPRINKYSSDE